MRGSALARGCAGLILLTACVRAQTGYEDQFPSFPYDHPAIRYLEQLPRDPVALLQQEMQAGQIHLDYHSKWGYLPDLLKRLGVHVDSQVLVFSKTSFQSPLISPAAPRALYFTDDVYIGTVQNGEVLEIASLDPRQGVQFYTLDVDRTAQPSIRRRDMACLQCHVSPGTLWVPGILVSSAFTSGDGTPIRGSQAITDHRTPLDDRWGGWFVTGTALNVHHRGNAVPRDPSETQNLASLDRKLDVSPYLAPSSDIVALMTIEHQTRMTDLMIRLGWEARAAAADGKLEAFRKRLDVDVDELVRYMLFADEARLPGRVLGNSTFTRTFPQRGPRDSRGRSLRDFDLQTRMFRYPLSYMIYSQAFDSMPDLVREAVYRKLHDVLAGADTAAEFSRLSARDRQNVLEIVRATKPGLPAYWRAAH